MNVPTSGGGAQDSVIKIILSVQADQSSGQQAQKTLNDTSAALDRVTKSSLSLKQAGRDLREIGATVAAGGAAILAPFIAAASQYEQQYKGLEATANNYAAAQRRQADATTSLGRSAAQALTPFLNDVANVEQKIADFAAAHPDIVQAVVGGGAVLATAGAGLAAIGQALVTVSNAAKLLGIQINSVGDVFGKMGQAVGAATVLWLGVNVAIPGTIDALNAFGKAIGDQNLATKSMTDIWNTAGQALALVFYGIAKVAGELVADLQKAQLDLQHFGDPNWVAATIRVPGQAQAPATGDQIAKAIATYESSLKQQYPTLQNNQLLGVVTSNLGLSSSVAKQIKNISDLVDFLQKNQSLLSGGSPLAQILGRNATTAELISPQEQADRAIDAATKAQVDKLKNNFSTLGAVGNFQGLINALGGIGGSIANLIQSGGKSTSAPPSSGSPSSGGGQSSNIAASDDAFIAYRKQINQSEIQYGQEELRIKTDYTNQELQTEKDRAAEGLQIARDRAAEEAKLESDQAAAKIKAAADFAQNEKQTDEKIAFEKRQRLYQQSLDAANLAAQGDVAAFISQQQQNIIQNTLQDRQNEFDKQQRQEQFDYQQKQQDIADQRARDQQKAQYKLEDQDRAAQYQKEDQDRATAYQNQLQALKTSHDDQLAEMQSAFVQQLADLDDNVGKLHDIRNQAYANEQADLLTFTNTYQTQLQTMYKNILAGVGTNAPFISPTSNSNGFYQSSQFAQIIAGLGAGGGATGFGSSLPSFASGTDYLPRDMAIYAHRGEAIIPASQNRGGGISISMPITLNGGSGANGAITKADLAEWGDSIVKHVYGELTSALGATT